MTARFPALLASAAFLLAAFPLSAQLTTAPKAVPLDLADKDGHYAPLPGKEDLEGNLRIQIYRDENNFGPGYLDGKIGEFGKKAASVYNQIKGIPVGNYFGLIEAAQKRVPELYTTYTIKEGDLKFISAGLPSKPQDQARTKYLGYRSLLEFTAERFHTSDEFVQQINGNTLFDLQPGDTVKVPNITPFEL